jgi:filamentous hemagglutinin
VGDALKDQSTEVRAAVHGIIGGALNAAMGGNAAVGAASAAATSFIVDELDAKLIDLKLDSDTRAVLLLMTSAAVGELSGKVAGDNGNAGHIAGFTNTAATEYNYLSHWQQQQFDKELKKCTGLDCAGIRMKWLGISAAQDGAFTLGFGVAVPEVVKELGEGIVKLALHPIDAFEGIRAFVKEDNILGRVGDAIKQDFLTRLDTIERNYEKAGLNGAYVAGEETGKLLIDTVSLGLGGVGAAKASAQLGVKLAKMAVKPFKAPARAMGNAENIALYPQLKVDLRQQHLNNLAKLDPRLAVAAKGDGGKLNFSIGSGTRTEANNLGKLWVGEGAQAVSNGGWISADGLRGYRPPTVKQNTLAKYNPTGIQANFETYTFNVEGLRQKIQNGHMVILD